MKCKTCGKTVHYCSSCGYDPYLFEDYCDQKCFEKSKEFLKDSQNINNFICSLSEEQMEMFRHLWKDEILQSCDIYQIYIEENYIERLKFNKRL